jgi:ADP-ribose pyrophosphatase
VSQPTAGQPDQQRADGSTSRPAETVQPWSTLAGEYLLRSPWRSIRRDRVRLHTGQEIEYSYAETPEAVFVVPVLTDGRIALIRQYRYPVRDWAIEVPAGSVPPGGDAQATEATARQELAEEIGGRCQELISLGWFYSSSAHLSLRSHAFVALGVELGATNRESTELLDVVPLDADEAFAWARDGRINEGQSALAVLMAEPVIRARRAARS